MEKCLKTSDSKNAFVKTEKNVLLTLRLKEKIDII